jgi:hypothetical protein
VTEGTVDTLRIRLQRVESDLGQIDGRTRAVEEASFRLGERFTTLSEALRDIRTELVELRKSEETRREKELETRHADRRALLIAAVGIVGTIVVATITVLIQGAG